MCNTFIPIATLPSPVVRSPGPASVALCQNRQASTPTATLCTPAAAQGTPGLLSEQTSKRPRTKGFKPIVVLPTAALQFAAAALDPWETFVRTDKQAPRKQRVSEPIAGFPTATLCAPAAAVSWARPGKLLSEQTSKQLSTGCPQFVVSYPQVTAE
jgi:hypothetical protein